MLLKISILILVFFSTSLTHAAESIKTAFTEGTFNAQIRALYFSRNYDSRTDREDIALGGMFYYKTDKYRGFTLGTTFYTGQGMGLNDNDKDVYGLLKSNSNGDHENYTALGEAYLQADFLGTSFKLGRQELETPWINGDDNRLTPQSVQGYVIRSNAVKGLEIFAGHITRMKGKTTSDFLSMTQFAGIPNVKKGVSVGGFKYSGLADLKLQIWDYLAHDFFNNIYFRADYQKKLNSDTDITGAFQYLNQDDSGSRLGGVTDTYAGAAEAGIETAGFKFTAGYAVIGDQDITYPWGHDFIVSAMINDSSRAEEDAFMLTLSYDFEKLGLSGLKGKIVHADFNTPDNGPSASYDYTETDFDLKYKFSKKLKGLGMRVRCGIINQDEALGGEDYRDIRIYVTYEF